MNNQTKEISNFSSSTNNPDITKKNDMISKDSNTLSSTTYEYVTKQRKTLYNSSLLNLESPKKQNPNKRNDQVENKNSNYKILIKRIAEQLRRRVRLPTCKIIKIYQPYRTLIMRIANGIKKTAKNYNFGKRWENERIYKDKKKFGISLMKKEGNNNSKKRIENEENIKILSQMNDSDLNVDFINDFEKYLGTNSIEILKETKLPSFKNEKNQYLLTSIQFWKKFINFICIKYREDISLYNFINLIEHFYLWVRDPDDSIIFNKLIKQKIELIFEPNVINDFLLMHKLNNLEDLFAKYKNINKNNPHYIEIKIDDYFECPSCQNFKEKVINSESIKFPGSVIKYKSKNSKITDYYGLSIKMKTSQYKTQKKLIQYSGDKKIDEYFSFAKVKKNKMDNTKEKEKEKSKSKNRSKSKSKNKKNTKISNNSKRSSIEEKRKEILDLLNLQP